MIVAKIYERGYGKNNLRTVTIDYENVFELVSRTDLEGMNTTAYITLGDDMYASKIVIQGSGILGIGEITNLRAVVYPLDIDDKSVMWEIVEGDDIFAITAGQLSSEITVFGIKEGVGKLRATAVKSREGENVSTEINVVVSAEGSHYDAHLKEAEYDGEGTVNLKLNTGTVIPVDVKEETEWYVE